MDYTLSTDLHLGFSCLCLTDTLPFYVVIFNDASLIGIKSLDVFKFIDVKFI